MKSRTSRPMEDKDNIYYIFIESPYFPLDNFYPCKVKYNGLTYMNSEAAFQSTKNSDPLKRLAFSNMTASQSKAIGKDPEWTTLRSDWEQIKDQVMYDIVRCKLEQNPDVLELLLSTGNRHIEEGNTWNDQYWGVDLFTRAGIS